ncbi:hypothetical protein A6R68_24245 [Neotoma lepida]|uniref:Uncharacterized protein n=1 Tax=Neotoma lepida TaxID=56216 RepID=A0A1A6HVK3_NEOLE|nr:hypothetical protein A6R68_24245 [Neotoma lepida]
MAVVAVLESILSCEACKNVSQLLQMPLFSDILLTTYEKPQFKIPTKLKEALRIAKKFLTSHIPIISNSTLHSRAVFCTTSTSSTTSSSTSRSLNNLRHRDAVEGPQNSLTTQLP